MRQQRPSHSFLPQWPQRRSSPLPHGGRSPTWTVEPWSRRSQGRSALTAVLAPPPSRLREKRESPSRRLPEPRREERALRRGILRAAPPPRAAAEGEAGPRGLGWRAGSHPAGAGLAGGGLTPRDLTRQALDARRRTLRPGASAGRPHLGQGCGLRLPRSGGRGGGGGGGGSSHFVLSEPRGPTVVFRSLAGALHLISAFRRCRQPGS